MRKKKKALIALSLACTMVFGNLSMIPAKAAPATDEVGTNYYVDSENGDDAADGLTPDTAWETLDNVNEKEFEPGDKILLKEGTQYHGTLNPSGSGTEEAPISIDIYNGDVIGEEAGERAAVHSDGEYDCTVLLENVSHWNISNLEVTNKADDNSVRRAGVNVEVTKPGLYSGFHLDNLYVHDVSGTLDGKDRRNGGIYFTVDADKAEIEGKETRFDSVLIENCYVRDVSRTGISMGWTIKDGDSYGYGGILPEDFINNYYHTNVVIRNNYVQRAGGDAIVPMYCKEPLIEYNVGDSCSQNTADNPNAMYNAGIWPWRCEDAVFQYNEVFGTKLNGDGQAFDCDFSRGTTYQYNYSHNNEGGFMLVCKDESLESIIRYNISQNDKRTLFMLSNPNEAVFYNNTFYIDGANIDSGHGGKASMYNNIFYNVGENKSVSWGGNTAYDTNLYYGFDDLPNDANKVEGDPKFVNPGQGGTATLGDMAIDTLDGYKLQADSPAIDAGKTIEDNGGRDYFGNPIADQKTDIGAAEYTVAEPSGVSTAVLEYAIELAGKADTEGVVDSVVKKFDEVLENAEAILARVNGGDASVTQEMIDQAWKDLINIMQYLSFKQGDKTDLQKVIDMASSLDLTKYLEEGQKEFTDALTAAREVSADGDAMQEEVDTAWKNLLKAMSELRIKPDKNALEELVNKAEGMSLEGVDAQVAAEFKTAVMSATAVLNDEQATQQEVDTAKANLQASIDKVSVSVDNSQSEENKEKEGTTGNTSTDNGTTSSSGSNAPAQKAKTVKSVKTGDETNMMFAFMGMLFAAGLLEMSRRKRKNMN